jgi:hypothetical protein
MKRGAKSPAKFWSNVVTGIGENLVRGLPAVAAIERDALLVRDALLRVAIAAEFPLAPALSIWRATRGSLLSRAIDAVPELLDCRDVRLWLKHWAAGEGKMQKRATLR